ncbi:MAG: hypothetical protein NTW20_14020, partial [Rhodobacterales bacterium]|nr:hypothetical protein [Rhodobacterales bacterium]
AFDTMLADLRAEVSASGCDRVLMSGEGLSGPTLRPDPKALASLAEEFDLTAVCFLRRQDTFAESLWNQRCKTGNENGDIGGFVNSARMARHMDYMSLLAPWAEVGRVVAVGFETAQRDGVAETFASAAGVPLPPAPRNRNVSPSTLCAAYMAVLNRLGIGFAWKQVEAAVAAVHADDPAPMTRRALGREAGRRRCGRKATRRYTRYGVTFPADMPGEPISLPTVNEARRPVRAIADHGPTVA